MHHGPVLGSGVLEIASAYSDHGGRCWFRCRVSCRALAVCIPLADTRSRRTLAQQHRAHWLRRIGGARRERLQLLVEHDLRRRHGIRLLPQPRVPPECGFARRLVHLRLGRNHVRRPIAAQRHASLSRPTLISAAGRLSAGPGRLHIAVRKGLVRLSRYIYLVRGQLQPAIYDPRIQCQVQPLARALIHRFSGRAAQRRLRLHARLCRRLFKEHHMPIQLGRLHIRSAGCTRRIGCPRSRF